MNGRVLGFLVKTKGTLTSKGDDNKFRDDPRSDVLERNISVPRTV